jgi:hypothetical protein
MRAGRRWGAIAIGLAVGLLMLGPLAGPAAAQGALAKAKADEGSQRNALPGPGEGKGRS